VHATPHTVELPLAKAQIRSNVFVQLAFKIATTHDALPPLGIGSAPATVYTREVIDLSDDNLSNMRVQLMVCNVSASKESADERTISQPTEIVEMP
jgi:hypothetical protein